MANNVSNGLGVAGTMALLAAIYFANGQVGASAPVLADIGQFRVGSALGEERAGFSGRAKVIIFTSLGDPDWAAIHPCLTDLRLQNLMESFTGVLIDENQEPDLELGLREQGVRVVVRPLNGSVAGLLKRGYSCEGLISMLTSAKQQIGGFQEKSPIYVNMLEDTTVLVRGIQTFGCKLSAKFAEYFEEFEGADDPLVLETWGSLSQVCTLFKRGNTNSDAVVDISDAVNVLSFLFLGEPSTLCEDAGDANDDGILDISDALFILSYLFLCGDPIPPPFRSLGVDATVDALGCTTQ